MATVVAFDPGLASVGFVAVETDGTAHRLRDLSVFVTSKTSDPKSRPFLRDDRVHRARSIRRWALHCLKLYPPAAFVIEDFGFIQQPYATACLAMGYQAIVDAIDEWWSERWADHDAPSAHEHQGHVEEGRRARQACRPTSESSHHHRA